MANHKSALKRIRQNGVRKVRNAYLHKTTRNMVRNLRSLEDKKAASELLPKTFSHIDKCVKKNIWHSNKGANLKSKLTKFVNSMN